MFMIFLILCFFTFRAWMWVRKDPYYVRFEEAGADKEALEKALKIELETTLRQSSEIISQTPYMLTGNYFHCRSLARIIREHGGKATVVRKHWWQKKDKFVEGPIKDANQ